MRRPLTHLLPLTAALLALLGLSLALVYVVRLSWVPQEPPLDQGRLRTGSFVDLFSGTARVNLDETTLTFDRAATAFTFPPDVRVRSGRDSERQWVPAGESGELSLTATREGATATRRGGGASGETFPFSSRLVREGRTKLRSEGVPVRNRREWYVWGITPGEPALLKLFEDGSGFIVGAVDLSPFVLRGDTSRVSVRGTSVKGSVVYLDLLRESNDGTTESLTLEDRGFAPITGATVVSRNVSQGEGSVRMVRVEPSGAGFNGAELSVSGDGTHWQSVQGGAWATLPPSANIYWKLAFPTTERSFETPFLDLVRVEYRYEL